MKRLGKLVIMQETEYKALVYAETRTAELISTRDEAIAHAADCAEEFERVYTDGMMREANRRAERKAAFTAGKFHAAGGYAHALMIYRAELQLLKEALNHYRAKIDYWRPFIAALETVPGCLMRIDDWSDNMAPADFETVGAQVAQERRQP